MEEIGCFWRNDEFHDATILLGSDSLLLEQRRKVLQDKLDGSTPPPTKRNGGHAAKKPKINKETIANGSCNPCAGASPAGDATSATESILTIPVHRIILSTGSVYFRTAICTLVGDRAAASGQGATRPFHPIIVVHDEDVEAAQGVLQFLYTKAVDSKYSTVSQLMHILLVADRWVVAGCVSSCCKALAGLPEASLTMEDVMAIYRSGLGPIPPSLQTNPDFKPVLDTALLKLLQTFGDVATVVASPALTAQLLRLPHAAILALLGSDALASDSEDSVLMLVSWWLEGQKNTAQLLNTQLVRELQQEIRYSRLSPTYITQALPLVPRLNPTSLQLSELSQFRSFTPAQSLLYLKDKKSGCPKSWFKPQRPRSTGADNDSVSLDLCISTAQLSQHLASIKILKEGGPDSARLSVSVAYKGLSISLALASLKNGVGFDILVVYLNVATRLPSSGDMAKLQMGIPSSFKIRIHSNVAGSPLYSYSASSHFHNAPSGWPDFAKRASKLPGDSSVLSWWDSFIVDGQIKLTAEFTDERTK